MNTNVFDRIKVGIGRPEGKKQWSSMCLVLSAKKISL
ncbi:hypothetical protein O3Q49_10530 [Enterococcus lactis]